MKKKWLKTFRVKLQAEVFCAFMAEHRVSFAKAEHELQKKISQVISLRIWLKKKISEVTSKKSPTFMLTGIKKFVIIF